MKTFKEYLTEVVNVRSIASSILDGAGNAPPFILTPTMLKRLDYSIPNVTAFHVTETRLIEQLVAKQNKKSTQLSVFLSMDDRAEILGGVETRGGVVVEMIGQIDAYFSMDAFTGRLKGGRRSIILGLNSDFGSAVMQSYDQLKDGAAYDMAYKLLKALTKEAQALRTEVLDKNVVPFLKKHFADKLNRDALRSNTYFELFRAIQNEFISNRKELGDEPATIEDMLRFHTPGGTKVMAKIVKDYLDGLESIMKKTPDYKKLFVMPFNRHMSYDEAVMSNFEIKTLHFYGKSQSAARAYGEDFNVHTKTWRDEDDLATYIEFKGEKFSEILRKKLSK